MDILFDFFRKNPARTFIPVVNAACEPLGIIRERSLKEYAFSKFGRDLLKNPSSRLTVETFIVGCPVAKTDTTVDSLLEIVSLEPEGEGVILTEQQHYAGFLSAQALLKLVHERNIASAQELNPLTKLPGNNRISSHIEQVTAGGSGGHVLCYFDIDHFKPFNDHYGFRRGDRVIQLLADLLKAQSSHGHFFVGHIGGDDFFAGFEFANGEDRRRVASIVETLIQRFAADAASLYDPEDRRQGYIHAIGRDGQARKYPLLNVSCAVIGIHPDHEAISLDSIAAQLAALKKKAKESPTHIAVGEL